MPPASHPKQIWVQGQTNLHSSNFPGCNRQKVITVLSTSVSLSLWISLFYFSYVSEAWHATSNAGSVDASRTAGPSAAHAFGLACEKRLLRQLNLHYFYLLGGRFYCFMHSYWNVHFALSPTSAWICLTPHLFLTLSGSGGNWSPNPGSVYEPSGPSEPGPTSKETSIYVLSRWHYMDPDKIWF